MKLIKATKPIPVDNSRSIGNPLGVWAAARQRPDLNFAEDELSHLVKVASFAEPLLVVEDAFDASSIKVATPDRMAVEVPGAVCAVNALLVTLAAAGLTPVAYAYENEGQLAINVSPQRSDAEDRRSFLKSTSALRGHTDASFNPSPVEFLAGDQEFAPSPDFLALACIRNPDSVPTKVAVLEDVLAQLSLEDVMELFRPLYLLSPQASFDLPADSIRHGSVLWIDPTGARCCRCSHRNVTVSIEDYPDAARALDNFYLALERSSQPIALRPGEILILNNRMLIHGRDAPKSEWQSGARWLVRMYANRPWPLPVCIDPNRPWVLN